MQKHMKVNVRKQPDTLIHLTRTFLRFERDTGSRVQLAEESLRRECRRFYL